VIPYQTAPFDPATVEAIDHAQHVFEEIIKLTPDGLGGDDRSTLLMAFGSLAMEHFRSIVMLCRSGVATGSALALFRPLVEAVVRGEWLYFCASEEQMTRFMKKELSLHKIGFAAMANAVDDKVGLGARVALYLPDYMRSCATIRTLATMQWYNASLRMEVLSLRIQNRECEDTLVCLPKCSFSTMRSFAMTEDIRRAFPPS
jgi:hypothetical protein